MRISRKESVKLKALLPKDAVSVIEQKINGAIGKRMIELILAGSNEDKHGVIEIATALAVKEKLRRNKINRQLAEL